MNLTTTRALFKKGVYGRLPLLKKGVDGALTIFQLITSHFGTSIESIRIIALSTLKTFWEVNPEYMNAKEPTLTWYRHALAADWSAPADIKQNFRNASILKDGRAVFNIAGNKYRLVV